MLVNSLRGERDQAIGKRRRPSFEGDEKRGSCASIVAVEDMSMRGVNNGRNACHPCGQPADEAGLGRVGVNDSNLVRSNESDGLQ